MTNIMIKIMTMPKCKLNMNIWWRKDDDIAIFGNTADKDGDSDDKASCIPSA